MTAASREHRADGFTMVEVLMTMLLLTIVLTGLAALQIQTIRQVTYSRQATEATRLGQSVIERYKLMPSSALVSTGGAWIPETYKSIQLTDVSVDGQTGGPFTAEFMIEESGTDQFLVTVRVSWSDMAQGNRLANVSLTTIRSRF